MRWTYKPLTFIHLLLAAQCIAWPLSSAGGLEPKSRLSRREPLPARTSNPKLYSPRRSRRIRNESPPPAHGLGSPVPGSPASGSPAPGSSAPSTPSHSGDSDNPDMSGITLSPGSKIRPEPRTPSKPRRKKYLKSDVKSHELKESSNTYRKTAKNKEKTQRKSWRKHDADHILEPQTVAHYLNNHRKSGERTSHKCLDALLDHLNHPINLKMLRNRHNQKKNHIVKALNKHDNATKFSPKVKLHILENRKNILETAKKIDDEFTTTGNCAEVGVEKPGGVTRAAKRMIHHAAHS